MRVDCGHHGFHGRLGLHRSYCLSHQLISLRTDDMYTQDFAERGIGNNLHKPVVHAKDSGLAVAHERKLSNLYVEPLRFGLSLRKTNTTNARLRIRTSGNAIPVNGTNRLAGNMANRN